MTTQRGAGVSRDQGDFIVFLGNQNGIVTIASINHQGVEGIGVGDDGVVVITAINGYRCGQRYTVNRFQRDAVITCTGKDIKRFIAHTNKGVIVNTISGGSADGVNLAGAEHRHDTLRLNNNKVSLTFQVEQIAAVGIGNQFAAAGLVSK